MTSKDRTDFGKMETDVGKTETDFSKIEVGVGKNSGCPVNGHAVCPFSGEIASESQKQVKPNLKLKVPQPIRLKNHLVSEENFDVLHSEFDEISGFVSIFYHYFYKDLRTWFLLFNLGVRYLYIA